MKLTKVEEWI